MSPLVEDAHMPSKTTDQGVGNPIRRSAQLCIDLHAHIAMILVIVLHNLGALDDLGGNSVTAICRLLDAKVVLGPFIVHNEQEELRANLMVITHGGERLFDSFGRVCKWTADKRLSVRNFAAMRLVDLAEFPDEGLNLGFPSVGSVGSVHDADAPVGQGSAVLSQEAFALEVPTACVTRLDR